MHTRWLRPYELAHYRPRRVLNVAQKDAANGLIASRTGPAVAANQVVTGLTYQHQSAGGGIADRVGMAINSTRINGTQAALPDFETNIANPYGPAALGDFWPNADKNKNHSMARQNSPLRNAPGFYHHLWQSSTFNGSSSTVTLRDATADDALTFPVPPPLIAPPPPGPPPAPPPKPGGGPGGGRGGPSSPPPRGKPSAVNPTPAPPNIHTVSPGPETVQAQDPTPVPTYNPPVDFSFPEHGYL